MSPSNSSRWRIKRVPWLGLALLEVALIGIASPGAASGPRALDDEVHAIDIDLGNVEAAIMRLVRETENPVARSKYYPLEKRLIDARVYYELKNYGKAAVMYMDVVDNKQFGAHPEKAAVLLELGFSLYKLRNYMAAREYLARCTHVAVGNTYGRAVRYLIEVGLETRAEKGLETAVALAGRVPGRSAELNYAYAKGLYRTGHTREAIGRLREIPEHSAEFQRAQYYLGVVLTERGKHRDAIAAFGHAAKPRKGGGGTEAEESQVVAELAQLAIGRLHLELKEYPAAIDAYQEIPRNSKNFHTALYEMTWAYVHSEQYEKALNALEVLLLTVEDEQLATQANILRGRLNIMLQQSDLAVETYKEIIERFSPLRRELDEFASRRENLAAYFRWLLHRQTDRFALQGAVISERASKWMAADEQLGEVIGLFDDMSFQRKDVTESEQIIVELEQALAAGNRVEIFPNLKHTWTRIIVSENALILLSQRVLNTEGRLARSTMSTAERAKMDALLQRRQDLEQRFARLPKTVQEYRQRKQNVHRRYANLRREAFLLTSSLKMIRSELEAMEKWLNEARYKEGRRLNPTQERRLAELLRREKLRMRELYRELDKLKRRISQDNTSVGAGDFVSQDEAGLRRRLLDAHAEEEALLNAVLQRLAGGDQRYATELRRLRRRIVGNFRSLGTLLTRINRAVDLKVVDYQHQLAAERKLVKIYRRRVDSFERDSGRIAREIGAPLFRLAHRRITDVVLEADLGIVDVAWKRKTAESDKIRALQEEQTDQMKRLQKTMQAILKD